MTTVTGTVELTVSVTSGTTISQVLFYDNNNLLGAGTPSGPDYIFSWDSTTVPDGTYVLKAVATDILNQNTAAQITISVVNTPAPPVVNWRSPAGGSVVSGTTPLTASATSSATITQVQFFENNVFIGNGTLGANGYTFDWDSTGVTNGSYTLKATATDNFSQSVSAQVSVTVNNTTPPPPNPPTISIVAPSSGSAVSGSVGFDATATPSTNATISNVKYYRNNILIGTATLSQFGYGITWDSTSVNDGNYTIKATVTDSTNATASDTITVVVNNNTLPNPPPGGVYVPDLHTSSDPAVRIDPIRGRSLASTGSEWPIRTAGGVFDSTAGLQTFINNQSSNAIIILTFSLWCNGVITLTGNQKLVSLGYPNPPSVKYQLIRTMSYPYRIRADKRQTLPGGATNPGYNPNGICAPWLYDVQGGDNNVVNAINNPYGTHSALGSSFGGYDGTAGYWDDGFDGFHFSTYTTTPFNQTHVNQAFCVYINSGQGVVNSVTTVPGSNPAVGNGGTTLGSPTITCPNVAGDAQFGGGPMHYGYFYPGYIHATVGGPGIPTNAKIIGVSPDGHSATMNVNATATASNAKLSVSPLSQYGQTIKSVSSDGKTLTFYDNTQSIPDSRSTRNSAWQLGPTHGGWEQYLMANPGQQSRFYYDANRSFSSYLLALANVSTNDFPQVNLTGSSQLVGIQLIGADPIVNGIAVLAVSNFSSSFPVVNEFQSCVETDVNTANNVVFNCDLLNPWGDGEQGGGQIRHCTIKYTGRAGLTAHFNNKVVDNCIFDLNRHEPIDIEGDGVSNVTITNCTFGGNGITFSSSVQGFTFTGNHSTNADIASGAITKLCLAGKVPWKCGEVRKNASGTFEPASSNFVVSNNNFELPTQGGASPYVMANVVDKGAGGLVFTNNKGIIGGGTGYILTPYIQKDANCPIGGCTVAKTADRCNPITASGNTAPNSIGQVAP